MYSVKVQEKTLTVTVFCEAAYFVSDYNRQPLYEHVIMMSDEAIKMFQLKSTPLKIMASKSSLFSRR